MSLPVFLKTESNRTYSTAVPVAPKLNCGLYTETNPDLASASLSAHGFRLDKIGYVI
jgi:hypothetical protein